MNDVRRAKLADRPLEAADQGRDQSRPTGSLRPPATATVAPVPRPSAARMTLADHSLRRGAACCARCSVADRRYPLAGPRLRTNPTVSAMGLSHSTLATS